MPHHILIAEDDPSIALALRDDLELEGYEVSVVENGPDAVDGLIRYRHGSLSSYRSIVTRGSRVVRAEQRIRQPQRDARELIHQDHDAQHDRQVRHQPLEYLDQFDTGTDHALEVIG